MEIVPTTLGWSEMKPLFGSDREKYILTSDLPDKVDELRRVGLETPDPYGGLFRELREDLTSDVSSMLGDIDVVTVSTRDLANEVITAARRVAPLEETYVISTCPEISSPEAGSSLEVNRVYSVHGEKLGLGPRPGFPPIEAQLANIKRRAGDMSILLVEDGAYSGSTISSMIEYCIAANIRLRAVVVGFAFPSAVPLLESINAHGIDLVVVNDFHRLRGWHPDHDFYPFVPGCGRVMGLKLGEGKGPLGEPQPFYSWNQASYSFPYLLPFLGDTVWEDWTGMPNDQARSFSTRCVERAQLLFREIERLNDHTLCYTDLMPSRQRVNLPLALDQMHLPLATAPIMNTFAELL